MSKPTLNTEQKQRRRELGAFYTPPEVVRFMLRSSASSLFARNEERRSAPFTVLDPACGDGAFLVEAISAFSEPTRDVEVQRTSSELRMDFFGVDVDAQAIEALQQRLTEEPGSCPTRFVCGDALTGPAFGEDERAGQTGLNWPQTFPDVAAAGGFDLVIGNPPYLREKNAKALFDRIADTPLGRRWRQPRMDFWHYFVHRGLDLLRPGGVLSFILNSYWMSATGAQRLIERLQKETTIARIVLLGNEPIFRDVTGRHMILQLRKGREETACCVLDLSAVSGILSFLDDSSDNQEAMDGVSSWSQSQDSLYESGRLIVAPASRVNSHFRGTKRLGEQYLVRQGIAENPPFVTRRMSEDSYGKLAVGEGVFVLTAEEVSALELSPDEQDVLRPYFATASIRREGIPPEPTHGLLYLTRQTAPELDRFPAIERHLLRFRDTLKRRREVRSDSIAWWHLHWPRQELLFTEPRILAVQMARQPTFTFAERPTFVGFSVNVIQPLDADEQPKFSLPSLSAILNSQPAEEWFVRHAKHRGVRLDISGTVLRDFPLPAFDEQANKALTDLSQTYRGDPTDISTKSRVEEEMNQLVKDLYGHRLPKSD